MEGKRGGRGIDKGREVDKEGGGGGIDKGGRKRGRG